MSENPDLGQPVLSLIFKSEDLGWRLGVCRCSGSWTFVHLSGG